MKIARVTVVDGHAHVEIEGMDTPVIVTEGKTLSLEMLAVHGGHREELKLEWFEEEEPRAITVAGSSKPG